MDSSYRTARLRAVWLLLVPFFYFAHPTGGLLLSGLTVSLLGLAVRAWSAGHIRKDEALATGGPYAYTRNPLYLGSLLIGVGVLVAGGQLLFAAIFAVFYVGLYGATVREESRFLEERFGAAYRTYAEAVPAILPRPSPYRGGESAPSEFTWARYRANREWEAALGVTAGFALLAAKLLWTA